MHCIKHRSTCLSFGWMTSMSQGYHRERSTSRIPISCEILWLLWKSSGFSMVVVVVSQFNGTSTPKGSYSAKTGDNDSNVNSSHYSLSTALCESIRYQAKSEHNVRQDLIPRVRHGEAALCTPGDENNRLSKHMVRYSEIWRPEATRDVTLGMQFSTIYYIKNI